MSRKDVGARGRRVEKVSIFSWMPDPNQGDRSQLSRGSHSPMFSPGFASIAASLSDHLCFCTGLLERVQGRAGSIPSGWWGSERSGKVGVSRVPPAVGIIKATRRGREELRQKVEEWLPGRRGWYPANRHLAEGRGV